MTSDNAIPQLTDVPEAPRDITRLYFRDGIAFGAPHAPPSTAITAVRTWDDEQLLDAAHVGAAGRELHPDLVAALCARYVDMAQAELDLQTATVRIREADLALAAAQGVAAGLQDALKAERRAHRGTVFARECAEALYVVELEERNRVAQLHAEASASVAMARRQLAQVSAEALNLRHQLAGTTPVGVAIALDCAAREPEADDTQVMHLEDLHPVGAEVGCG